MRLCSKSSRGIPRTKDCQFGPFITSAGSGSLTTAIRVAPVGDCADGRHNDGRHDGAICYA